MELLTIYFFVLGLVLASFLNATAYRLEKGFVFPDIFVKGSHCETCKKKLTWVELIPVISFFMYRGRCRKCNNKIFWYYPLSEFLLGLTLALMWTNGVSFYAAIPVFLLFFLSYFDMTSNSVPQIFVNAGIAFALLDLVVRFYSDLGTEAFYPVILAIVVGAVMLIMNLFRKSFGLGDVLLIFFVSVFLAINQFEMFLLLTLFFSSAVSAVLLFRDRKWLKKYIPLVPFMYLAFVLALIYTDSIAAVFAKALLL